MTIKTYNEIYLDARRALRQTGIDAFEAEARLIMTAASGKTMEQFLRDRHLYVTDPTVESTVDALLARRLAGEPMAYILGQWQFYGMPVTVGPGVLIPRIDTEVLAEQVIALYKRHLKPKRILDLCAGTGCVGMAIAANVPFCRVILADTSAEALRLCRQNTMLNQLTRTVTAIEADAFEDPPMLLGQFDAIVCNPPYIPSADIDTLDQSVRDYEPREALDGGEDGLDFYRAIASKWRAVLIPGGRLAFECGIGQAEDIRALMAQNGFTDIQTHKDTLDIERVVIGTVIEQED